MMYKVVIEVDDVVICVFFDLIVYYFNFEIEYVNYFSFNDILVVIEIGNVDFVVNIIYIDLCV